MRGRKNTPKYGIIYQTKVVANANGKAKGRIARTLAAKSSLCVRVDALAEEENDTIGTESKDYIEKRLDYLEKEEQNAGTRGGQANFQRQGNNHGASRGYSERGDVSLGKRNNFNQGYNNQGGNKRFKQM